jgi:sulfur-carrier protein
MAVTVLIPPPLQKLTNGQSEVHAEGATVGAVVSSLEQQFPGGS